MLIERITGINADITKDKYISERVEAENISAPSELGQLGNGLYKVLASSSPSYYLVRDGQPDSLTGKGILAKTAGELWPEQLKQREAAISPENLAKRQERQHADEQRKADNAVAAEKRQARRPPLAHPTCLYTKSDGTKVWGLRSNQTDIGPGDRVRVETAAGIRWEAEVEQIYHATSRYATYSAKQIGEKDLSHQHEPVYKHSRYQRPEPEPQRQAVAEPAPPVAPIRETPPLPAFTAPRDRPAKPSNEGWTLFAESELPGLGLQTSPSGQPIVYTKYGRSHRIDDSDPSIQGSQLLGHEGESAVWVGTRQPTDVERATWTASQEKSCQDHQSLRGLLKSIDAESSNLHELVLKHPSVAYPEKIDGSQIVGETILDTRKKEGHGEQLVVGTDKVWYLKHPLLFDDDDRRGPELGNNGSNGAKVYEIPKSEAAAVIVSGGLIQKWTKEKDELVQQRRRSVDFER